jgi:hypothetical protein
MAMPWLNLGVDKRADWIAKLFLLPHSWGRGD